MKYLKSAVLGGAVAALIVTVAVAQNLTPAEEIDARTKVETAVALAAIAEAEGDGDAMLVAAKLFASVGTVAKKREKGAEPTFYSVGDVAAAAKALGADAGKADALANSAASAPTTERGYCYWDYECGTFECGWIYVCT